MKRRDFLKITGGLSAQIMVGNSILSGLAVRRAEADTGLPIQLLQSQLNVGQNLILLPASAEFAKYNIAFNKRTQVQPQMRVVVGSPEAVQSTMQWAKDHGLRFALRSGGHSYEGFSQSPDLVIDVRGMSQIHLEQDKSKVTVGSGAALGQVYQALAPSKLAIPAGSCFPVGVAGHTLGGGFGLLARPFGLACDAVESMEMVDANGQIRTLSTVENPDLFWAVRGGGNGNFGIVTKFVFRPSSVDLVATFSMGWSVPIAIGVKIARAWQEWLETLDPAITCTFHMGKDTGGQAKLHVSGLSVKSESALNNELRRLQRLAGHSAQVHTLTHSFLNAATTFNGPVAGYETLYMKAKSDYLTDPMSEDGFRTLLEGLQKAQWPIAVMADSYGGAVNKIPVDQTAFVHRGNTRYSLQYYMEWQNPGETNRNVETMRTLYDSMRAHVSGGCYVNYCDLDLKDRYPEAYWGSNLSRLKQLKALYDPENIFRHAQSIPLS